MTVVRAMVRRKNAWVPTVPPARSHAQLTVLLSGRVLTLCGRMLDPGIAVDEEATCLSCRKQL